MFCDNLKGQDWGVVGGRLKREEMYIYSYDRFVMVYSRNQHKHGKAIILPLKVKNKQKPMIKTKTKHKKGQSQESLSLFTLYQLTFPGLVSSSVKGEKVLN